MRKRVRGGGPQPVNLSLSCESVELWLSECEDPEGPVPSAIGMHLDGCPSCRAERDDALILGGEFSSERRARRAERFSGRHLTQETADPFFVRSVMARVREELPPLRRRALERRRQWQAAAAAVLVSAVALWAVFLPGDEPPAGVDPTTPELEGAYLEYVDVVEAPREVLDFGFLPVAIPDEETEVVLKL